jgi:sugar/nucleoside kinase (ribokinase family)
MTPDYLAIGHVSRDEAPDGPHLGGSVTYSTLTAHAAGLQTAIVTSAPPMDPLLDPLRHLSLHVIPAEKYTTFENVYTPAGRAQTLRGHAARLDASHVPSHWTAARIVHLAPVANEIDPDLIDAFPHAFTGLTPQGWMRRWDTAGQVLFQPWQDAERYLARADAAVMSIEDVRGDEALIQSYARFARVFVVTRGAEGCTVFVDAIAHNIPAPAVDALDPTGAGDIFAAMFFMRLYETGDPMRAAKTAISVASASVTRVGLDSIPSSEQIASAIASED